MLRNINFIGLVVVICFTATASHVRAQSTTKQDSAAPAQPKVVATRLSAFGVPFEINAQNSTYIEVQLYLSRDLGRTWSFFARQTTDQAEFPFEADKDGEYWFALKTLSRDRQLLPPGDPRPELKILVDTQPPQLNLELQADPAGRVVCRWRATDKHLAPESLKLMYQPVLRTGSALPWQTVPVNLQGIARNGVYADQVGWWPDTTESVVNVSVEILDTAGNPARETRRVNLPATAWRSRSQSTARPLDTLPRRTLKPATALTPNATTSGPPEQPDWAFPGWQPAELPKSSGTHSKQPPAQRLRQQISLNTPQTSTPKTSDHKLAKPPNVVCKNGICELVPTKKDTPLNVTASSVSQGRRKQIAQQRIASTAKQPLKLVGSPVELAAPPTPAGYVFKPAGQVGKTTMPVAPRVARLPQQESIAWESENKIPSSGSAKRVPPFDASITPLPTSQSPQLGSATNVPSNPGRMFFDGDKVISQSSTQGPNNQYRGNQTIDTLPQPTLLPGYQSRSQDAGSANRQTPPTVSKQLNGQSQARRRTTDQPFSQANYRPRPTDSSNTAESVVETSQRPSRNTRAPVQIIGSNRFRLDYGIDAIDPSGVDKVVLWITRNDGQTWNVWGTDPDRRSPFPVETTEDGRYGFRIVVKSRDGLTGQGPASGDDADIWINVDTQAPLVRITSVPYGRGPEAGKLVVNFKASDSFLTLRPITLSYAASPQGPWQVIQDGIRNTERYVWKVGREVPEQVYLKIEVADRAGNLGVHTLKQAVDVSGLVPRGTIRGVTPVQN